MIALIGGVLVGLIIVAIIVKSPTRPPSARRAHPEVRYAARTAERAGIFWLVYRGLNGLFRR